MKKLVANCFDPRFSLYRAQISARNAAQLQVFAAVGTTLAALFALMELVLSEAARFFTAGLVILVYFCLLLAVNALALRRETRFATLLCYAEQMPLMLTAILMGTFWDPARSAITILLFLCVLPMLILDAPWRVNLYSTGIAAAYAVCCALAKAPTQFEADMINLLTYWLVSMVVSTFLLRERIDSVAALARSHEEAARDDLTGVYNRRGGSERIARLLERGVPGAFMIVDIDNFKKINDTYGHIAGDEALAKLAEAITRNFRNTDVVMRLGGDEFTVYAVGMVSEVLCRERLQDLLTDVRGIMLEAAGSAPFSVSVGCVLFPEGRCVSYEDVYRRADTCLYRAKGAGRDCYVLE